MLLRVRVLDDDNIPIQGLKAKNFQVETTDARGQTVTLAAPKIKLLSSQQVKVDPAYIIMLLDMSGSMKRKDSKGEKKLVAAVEAIREVIREVRKDNLPVNISLVPFAEGGGNCQGFQFDENKIDRDFLEVTESSLDRQLDELAAVNVCGSTNIYDPVAKAARYLGIPNRFEQATNLTGENTPPPRLAVILLSDGYDVVERSREAERFNELKDVLQQNPQVPVHTMGYGEYLYQLRDRIRCPLSDAQLTVDNVRKRCKSWEPKIEEFIVDDRRLEEIARITGGIYKHPGNAREVVDSLRTFLTTLRDYELTYEQPGADRASRHQTTVRVVSPFQQINLESDAKDIRMNNFNYCPLNSQGRINMLVITALLGLALFLPFIIWSRKLKAKAKKWLY